ncbi:hypothetical protein HPP92_026108 [Vanilla planifolia]|uniref:Uncharacterized protein n=1 Tax=Vanilla planifolia TaxID=51239 RepID=A0A835U8B1_VANPL|nr:hypothetical protein HPP92_026108 [Vanilla planifolia]
MTDITIMNGQLRFTTGCDEWTVDGDAEKFGALLRGLRCWEDERIWNGWEDKMKGIQKDLRLKWFTTGCDEWTVDGDAEKFGALLRGLRCWEDERIWNGWEDKMKGIQKDLRVEVVWNGPSSFIKLDD